LGATAQGLFTSPEVGGKHIHRRATLNRLAGRTGVDRARLSRFVRGERGLSLTAVDELCLALGLRLVGGEGASAMPATGRRKPKGKGE